MRRLVAALLVCLAIDARAQTTDHGPAFHALDAETTRVITWFADSYAITERGADQRLQTRLFDRRSSAVLATSEYAAEEGRPATWRGKIGKESLAIEQAAAPRRHTAWANTQLRELWLDQCARTTRGVAGPPEFSTHGGMWRIRDAVDARRGRGEPWSEDGDVEAIATEFGPLMAVVSRDPKDVARPARGTARSTFTARMFDAGGRGVGWVRWFEKERVLTWSFPNGRRGTAMESNVPGGFKFTPTMGWVNVQALAFLKQSGRGTPGLPAGAARLAPTFTPTGLDGLPARGPNASGLEAQEGCDGVADGCTGLHFLDGTIFEECCTKHDLCYERDAPGGCCEAWSWLVPNPFWHCARCNFAAVWCFLTRAQPDPDWLDQGPLGECERQSYRDWCAPECATCRTREDTGRN